MSFFRYYVNNSKHYLLLTQNRNLSGKFTLSVTAKHAFWGSVGDGLNARIYVKTGSDWTWHAGNALKLNSSGGSLLSINLASIPNLGEVRDIGVEFLSSVNSSGQTGWGTWSASAATPVDANGFTTITLDISGVADRNLTQAVGVQIMTTDTVPAGSTIVYVDEITIQ